eukprot:Phypoly_transcript_02409.p1 GENE.Phypoly_transcript_02409~~Phypoly_transcript_02409.p1  ORF type:complete len:900 (+),score=140.14 Phypoly_transcript_02409:101-2800(+)
MLKGLSHQGQLQSVVEELFPGVDVLSNVRKEGNIRSPTTGRFLEIDVWVPDHLISFEFQDPYHYVTTWESQVPLDLIQQNDDAKTEILLQRGETLVPVPCWWDSQPESLRDTICFHRPDLKKHASDINPISLNPQNGFFASESIPDVRELMPASFPVMFNFTATISLDDSWWMGEKYDGVRCCWHAQHKLLYTRSGYVMDLQEAHVTMLKQACFMDGEVWFGRGFFQDSFQFLSQENMDMCFLRMVVFDNPDPVMQGQLFEDRYQTLVNTIPFDHSFVAIAARIFCASEIFSERATETVITDGGEGIILRKPGSMYELIRSPSLIKIKASRADKDALVLEVEPDNSLLLKMADGTRLTVDAENNKLNSKAKRGDIVTFSFDNYSRGLVPISPKVFRIRTDITWEDVLQNDVGEKLLLNDTSLRALSYANKPAGYWTSERGKNMRDFFVELAKKRNFDPLVPENWYSVSVAELREEKGFTTILSHFSGNFRKALHSVFPEIGLEANKFATTTRFYWTDLNNRRKSFEDFARDNNFDPLVAENWYPIAGERIAESVGSYSLKFHYNGSFTKALIHLFPEVPFQREKFIFVEQRYWADMKNRRRFFEDYANTHNFDPLHARYWYAQHAASLATFKGAAGMVAHYGNNYRNALIDVFPELELDEHKFLFLSRAQGKSAIGIRKKRTALENFARVRGQEPLDPEFWYSLNPRTITSQKINNIIEHYSSLTKALLTLFPEIGLDETRLPDHAAKVPAPVFIHERKRRFEMLAEKLGFDPLIPAGWYTVSLPTILTSEVQALLSSYDNNFVKALLVVFPNIGLDEKKFPAHIHNSWIHSKNRQRFVDIAALNNFDPLTPNNWYQIANTDLVKTTKSFVATYYSGNIRKALVKLFPEINFAPSLFVN